MVDQMKVASGTDILIRAKKHYAPVYAGASQRSILCGGLWTDYIPAVLMRSCKDSEGVEWLKFNELYDIQADKYLNDVWVRQDDFIGKQETINPALQVELNLAAIEAFGMACNLLQNRLVSLGVNAR